MNELIQKLNWGSIYSSLDDIGYSKLPRLLSSEQCSDFISFYYEDHLFRNVINMERYRFGEGEYKYFDYPLPPIINSLRECLYPYLSEVANKWAIQLGENLSYPSKLHDFLDLCHNHEQMKATPLILRYEKGGYNCLHQDLYGDISFPFQVLFMLSDENAYEGGEFLLIEQRPRAQSRGHVIKLSQGEGLIFPTHHRPILGKRGFYRARLKHGVSNIQNGERYTLGIIFHDAK